MSRNKIFRCAYFSMHFRIKLLLFNDFPSYISNFDTFLFCFNTVGKSAGVLASTILLHIELIFCVTVKTRVATVIVAKRIWSYVIMAGTLRPFTVVSSLLLFCDCLFSYRPCNWMSCKIPRFIPLMCFYLL